MKIQRIKIKSFKNLRDIDIDCSKHQGLTLVIGKNGSGKSNLLEGISDIFYSKYAKAKSPLKNYEISYQDFNKRTFIVNDQMPVTQLPQRIVAIYSGEEDRMWKQYYFKLYQEYIKTITGDKAIEFPKMLYLNKYYWQISLLCLICSDAQDVKEFVQNNLGIESIESIEFKKNTPDFRNNHVLEFTNSLNDKYNSLDEFKVIFGEDRELFLKLYIAFTDKNNKLITDVVIKFNGGRIIEDLSEGQKKQLLIKSALEFAGQEDTLFLLDEPDAYVHVANKKSILEIIEPYKSSRHIIITTHSPTLTQLVDEKHILLLDNGKIDEAAQEKLKSIKHLVGKDSFYNVLFGTRDILLVEGKTDKEHIVNAFKSLKLDYPTLDFDIISMNSSTFIKQAMIGLSNSEVTWNKKFIAIFDNDKEGKESISKNFKTTDGNANIKQIFDGNGNPSNEFFAFLLPKPEGYTEDLTIENYYHHSKLEEAYKMAIKEKEGYFENLSIETISSDLKNKSKTILSDLSKDFTKPDFDRFKLIFDFLIQIQTPVNLPHA